MMVEQKLPSRRDVIFRVMPACSLCFGLPAFASGGTATQGFEKLPLDSRAASKTEMTYTDLFDFAYGSMIPVIQNLCNQIGKNQGLEMLSKATYEKAFQAMASIARDVPERYRDLTTFLSRMRSPSPLYKHALTYEFLKDSEKEADIRITECLWARTFRKMDAGDIGYAMVCVGDEGTIKAYNPKIVMSRPKLLMRGEGECRFLYNVAE